MKINIYGSTGEIGKKALNLIDKNFTNLKVNLLCANNNYKLIIKQIEKYKPNYVYLDDLIASKKLKLRVDKNTKILTFDELILHLKNSSSHFSILAISGYKSLIYLEYIISNTQNLGIVSKEAIVSAGHIFKKKNYFSKTKIFPLDSEHFSLYEFFNFSKNINNLKRIIITASGGPFYKHNFKSLNNVSFNEAIKHPKWKMGYKNSIDSATLVNKCLEVIEAHYLFDIPYNKIKVLIHPEAIVHSIVEKNNYVSHMNFFKNDMSIPIFNFLMTSQKSKIKYIDKFYTPSFDNLNFMEVSSSIFPIYNFFIKMNKSNPANIIKFNIANEIAVDMFKNKQIKYTDIYKIIKKVVSLNLYSPLNNIKDIIKFHEKIKKNTIQLFSNY